MEFELEGGSFEVEGNVEVTLPDYMTMLPKEELDEARRASQAPQMIVAAGVKPGTTEIVMFTADNRLLVLDAAAHGIPPGKVLPIDWGHGLAVDNEEMVKGYYEIAADWAIENASPIDVTLLA